MSLSQLLGVQHPIVLGPFGGLSSVALTAAVSNRGGLGSYGLYGYDADRIATTVADLRAATAQPFALNLWLPLGDDPVIESAEFDVYADALRPFFDELGLDAPTPPDRYVPPFEEQWRAVLATRPAVASFVFGVPPAEVVDAAHAAGIVLLGTATTVDEAVALERGGVDAIVASGSEAAGHRVSFLQPAADSLVGTIALIPQAVDAVSVPVIAAGGIADRRGVAAAFALGAHGVQVGTAFLRTEESAATASYRLRISETPAHGTALTEAMSGRLARGIRNRAVRTIEASRVIAPFPAQNWLTGRFRTVAAERDDAELLSLWAGQASPLARHTDAATLFDELVAGLPNGRA